MSSAIVRRNSSKEGLQNLLRITAQRSIEDAEEIERERRRRAREAFRSTSSQSDSPRDGGTAAEDSPGECELKPSSQQALEEDEGFSDWTQKLERRRQRRLEEQGPAEEEDEDEERRRLQQRGPSQDGRPRPHAAPRPPGDLRGEDEEEEEEEWDSTRRSGSWRGGEAVEEKQRVDGRMKAVKREEEPKRERDEMVKEKRKEVKVSYTSKVFLSQEVKHLNGNGDAAGEEVTSYLVKTKRPLRSASHGGAQEAEEEAEVFLETEQKLEKIRRSHQEKESQELELLRHRQAEAEAELEELKKRREERRKIREEEERRREEEEYQRQLKEEEERRHMKEEIERRRMEAAERRMKSLSTSSVEGEEPFSPLSPKSSSFKGEGEERPGETAYSITERTESLNRSLKKSSSIKKTQPPLLTSRIDNKLEQYSHAIEEAKLSKQGVVEIPCPPEPVASKKSLFEAGDAWNQNSPKTTPSKDTEGLKVGVADLITQWVKGSPDCNSKSTLCRPADIKPGDVLHKKNMWESIRDSSSTEKSAHGGKGTPSGKRYKFVVTGHGKYEKIPVDDGEFDAYVNEKSTELCHQDS